MATLASIVSGLMATSGQNQKAIPATLAMTIANEDIHMQNNRQSKWKDIHTKCSRMPQGDMGSAAKTLKAWLEDTESPAPKAKAKAAPTAKAKAAPIAPTAIVPSASTAAPTAPSASTAAPTVFTASDLNTFADIIANRVHTKIDKQKMLMIKDEQKEAKTEWLEQHKEQVLRKAARRYLDSNDPEEDPELFEMIMEEYLSNPENKERVEELAAEKYANDHVEDEDFIKDAKAKWCEDNHDEVLREAAGKWAAEHDWDDDDDFKSACIEAFTDAKNEDVLEAAATQYLADNDPIKTEELKDAIIEKYIEDNDEDDIRQLLKDEIKAEMQAAKQSKKRKM